MSLISAEKDLDATDRNILLFVTKGYGSSYSIWSAMKKEAKEKNLERKVMTYRNTNKRVIKLIKLGLIEKIKPDTHTSTVNIHGRKDYKVTMKGMELLMDNFETSLKWTNEYMESVNEFLDSNPSNPQRYTPVIRDLAQIERIFSEIKSLVIKLHENEQALIVQSKRVKSKPESSLSAVVAALHDDSSRKPILSQQQQKKKH